MWDAALAVVTATKLVVALIRQALEGSCKSVRVYQDIGTVFTLQRLLLLLYWGLRLI
jgi:hypothetical protein